MPEDNTSAPFDASHDGGKPIQPLVRSMDPAGDGDSPLAARDSEETAVSAAGPKRAALPRMVGQTLRLTERNLQTRWLQESAATRQAGLPLLYRVGLLILAYQTAANVRTQRAYEVLGIRDHTLRRALKDRIRGVETNRYSLAGPLDNALGLLADAGRLIRRTREAFEAFECAGEDAPARFIAWLTTPSAAAGVTALTGEFGLSFLDAARRDPQGAYRYIKGGHRDAIIQAIWDHLKQSGDGKPLMCLASPGMAHGLTALAIHLAETRGEILPGDRRPWCYLPVNRTPQVEQHGEVALIAQLAAFYDNKDPMTAKPGSPAETQASIRLIRKRMARFPAILVFDGYSSLPGEAQHLLDFVGHDPLAPLLDRIVRPFVGRPEDDIDTALFHKTRILVLGNRGLDEAMRSPARGRHRGLNVYISRTEHYPGPQSAQLGTLADLLGLCQASDEVACRALFDALQHYPPGVTVSDTGLQLTAALARLHYLAAGKPLSLGELRQLLQGLRNDGSANAGLSPGQRGRETLELAIERLCEAICEQLLAARLEAWHALAFIALDLGGMRAATIRRLMSVRYDERHSEKPPAAYAASVEAHLKFLTETLLGVVVTVPESGRKELYADDRETEYDPVIWGDVWRSPSGGGGRNLTYEIPDTHVRAALRTSMCQRAPGEIIIIERLLAEEALQQHTILARHGTSGRDESLRSKERLVEAIYHGLMSVPPRRAYGEGRDNPPPTPAPDRFPAPPELLMALPADPQARLRRLFTDLYCDRLERRPQWALTRSWEAVHLKGDILSLFLARMDEPPPERTDTDYDRALFNAAVAAERSADLERFRHLRAQFPLECAGHFRQPYERLVIDNHVAQNRSEDALALCRRYIKDYAREDVINPLPQPRTPRSESYLATHAGALADKIMAAAEFAADDDMHWSVVERVVTVRANQGADLASKSTPPPEDALAHSQAAYVLYLVLERVRDRMVALGRAEDYDFGAAVTRFFARTALFLARLTNDKASQRGFRARARIAIDHMTRAADRFPTDRAQHLIIEAYLARVGHNRLDVAAERLIEAEALLPSEHEQPGVNLRFLLERAEVFYASERLAARPERKRRLRAIADRDNARLVQLAGGPYQLPAYCALAQAQRERWSRGW